MINLAVLFGGVSPEHEISKISAAAVMSNLDKTKYNVFPILITKTGEWFLCDEQNEPKTPCIISPDRKTAGIIIFGDETVKTKIHCVFPVLHGENGEDGTVQGLLELSGIPYVGCNVASSANSMDKSITKIIVNALTDVRQAKFVLTLKYEFEHNLHDLLKKIDENIEYPMFVKPCNAGSSVGVHKAHDKEELLTAFKDAFLYDDKVLIEEYIKGQEVEVAVKGNRTQTTSTVGEIVPSKEFYSYEAKYEDDSKLFIPARISQTAMEKIKSSALKIYCALGCRGLSRVDFFCTENDEIVFNEINTSPGFTSVSMYPKLFIHDGLTYTKLLDELIELSLSHAEEKKCKILK